MMVTWFSRGIVSVVASMLILAAGVGSLEGQSTVSWGRLTGRVADNTGAAVIGAVLSVDGTSVTAITDSRGGFSFAQIAPGTHTILVRALGYAPVEAQTLIRTGTATNLAIELTRLVTLESVTAVAEASMPGTVTYAPQVTGGGLVLAGTGNTIVQLRGVSANLAEKSGRQIFARIPGVFVYDMDGSGNQINIATRGLDPHRSWELNVRQDGILLNSDLYGYPASHYSPPMEAIERVEVIRGTAALQYGSQYGGLVNYVTKGPQTERAAGIQSVNTIGSYGLLSTYNGVGGDIGRVKYYGYVSERRSDGYRDGAKSDYSAQFLTATVPLSPTLSLRGQIGHSVYTFHIPGPLTDSMFAANPRQATRERNFYSPDITIPSLTLDWKASNGTSLTSTVSGVFGPRNSVQFQAFANVPDAPNPTTGLYATRDVDIDKFRSLTWETRLIRPWFLAGRENSLAVGVGFLRNHMIRKQLGKGSTGSDFDLSITADGFRRDMTYNTVNGAFYMENLFRLSPQWTVTPGMRVEVGETKMRGHLAYYDPASTPKNLEHHFPSFGIRTSYQLPFGEFYGGWSQGYRPMILRDVIPGNDLERTDPDMEDSKGWTAEAGIRGTLGSRLGYEVSAFQLQVGDRFGTLLQTDQDGKSYLLRTNVGTSRNRGLETSLEFWFVQREGLSIWANTATSYYRAKYLKGTVVSAGQNVDIAGNTLETVPRWISRNGISAEASRLSGSVLLSYTSSSFADPLNTVKPSANGAVGLVPSYTVVDASAGFAITSWMNAKLGVSNIFDKMYFTKRPQGYPGAGVWPSDGRSVQFTLDLSHWP